ncbi:MAG: DUF1360 domain-containing protein [Planctomycetes bacterium]|nr:DUF1360 domain-containing protein [Planctomycetota bacterium]NOG84184.1 DUF1360 domain-containing protein [Planctomycetota bacterium]
MKIKNSFLGELFSCSYCFGHWVAFAFVTIYQPKLFEVWWLLDYFFMGARLTQVDTICSTLVSLH